MFRSGSNYVQISDQVVVQIAFILFKINLLPALFLTAMGIFQFYTAILGGILAFGFQTIKKKL